MNFFQVLILAILQGACELLPVSSSAHVIIAEKIMGIDPSAPEMTLLLVMLHTGTMLAVIIYFRKSWKASFFRSGRAFMNFARLAFVATFLTGAIGLALKVLIEKVFLSHVPNAEVELIFGNLGLISLALAAVGVLIITAGRATGSQVSRSKVSGQNQRPLTPDPKPVTRNTERGEAPISVLQSAWIGTVQAFCLPFRGFSRSGATISTGLFLGIPKKDVEDFSFALVVILTPPVILKEVHRLLAHHAASLHGQSLFQLFAPSLVGMAASFTAGLLALKWLSNWLERGRWSYFGYYCLVVSAFAFLLYKTGM